MTEINEELQGFRKEQIHKSCLMMLEDNKNAPITAHFNSKVPTRHNCLWNDGILKFSSIKPNWDFMQTVNNKWNLHYLVKRIKLQLDPEQNEEHRLDFRVWYKSEEQTMNKNEILSLFLGGINYQEQKP